MEAIISIGSVYRGLQLGNTNVYDVLEVYLSVLTFLVTLMDFSHLQRNLFDNLFFLTSEGRPRQGCSIEILCYSNGPFIMGIHYGHQNHFDHL